MGVPRWRQMGSRGVVHRAETVGCHLGSVVTLAKW